MSIPVHQTGREQFLEKLDKVVSAGCLRWQARREAMSAKALEREVKAGIRKLNRATFLKTEVDEAFYAFWRDGNDAVENPERVWLETKRRFGQRLIAMRRAGWSDGEGRKTPWFEKNELDELEADFERFWDIEKGWLGQRRERTEGLILYKRLGAEERLNEALRNPDKMADFFGWVYGQAADPYTRNKYRESVRVSNALVAGLRQRALHEQNEDVGRAVWLAEAMNRNIKINTRELHVGAALTQVFKRLPAERWEVLSMEDSELLVSVILVFAVLTRLDEASKRFTGLDNSLSLFLTKYFLDARRIAVRRAPWWMEAGDGLVELMTGIMRGFVGSSIEEARSLVKGTLQALRTPRLVAEREMRRMVNAGKGADRLELANGAVLCARSWMDDEAWNEAEATKYITVAIDALTGCKTHLAWLDVYWACEQYMRQRGNTILTSEALKKIAVLEKASQNEDAASEVMKRQRTLEENPLTRQGGTAPKNEEMLRTFLHAEPPSLRRGLT